MNVEYKLIEVDNTPPIKPIPLTEKKAVVVTEGLHIREDHAPNAKILGHLKKQDEVTVLETVMEGNNIWVKLKPDAHLPQPEVQWAAMLIGKDRYISFIESPKG